VQEVNVSHVARWKREQGSDPLSGSLGEAWPLPYPSELEEGSWAFRHGGRVWYCAPEDLELLRPWEEGVRVGDLEDGRYLLVSDSQDRRAVLESLGLEEEASEWPHLFVWAGDGEYVEVWGCRFDVPRLDDPAVPLFPPQGLETPSDDPDWLEAKEWEDFGGPDLPSEW
jgi:hypothetical protein